EPSDSNREPREYESPALTVQLRSRHICTKKYTARAHFFAQRADSERVFGAVFAGSNARGKRRKIAMATPTTLPADWAEQTLPLFRVYADQGSHPPVALNRPVCVIGRDYDANLPRESPQVSRHHALI